MATTYEQWDIVSSVGLTALGVAAARAVETQRAQPLVRDEFAARFVDAVRPPTPLPTSWDELGEEDSAWRYMIDYMALRTRFLDDYFAGVGVDQVVILAAGLDARAFRLDWPSGCDLYEIDQPKVLEFKQQVVDEVGARPRCRWHPVPTDLRDDWVAALTVAGFDPARPTAWLAEGLLAYLPGRAEEELFERVHELSAPASTLAVERSGRRDTDQMQKHPMFARMAERFGVNIGELFNTEPRRDFVEWIGSVGWDVTVHPVPELERRYHRTLVPEIRDMMAHNAFVVANWTS
ncbi:putative S-adenosyl-L-methionine-dependent methyltransferase [Longimycelium tulufanense]|uniref:S-adenosyl-L-methionine-dependent methyltransferase n=1 Tax=Longimycelium tulufanense TaxID=907463 RepID=A0A8J3C915_9PSEU|nr:class I SAM-dependent methyltransferase [Longimycelium tulufanense]GGM36822.1 putative S-adenosyl-L-methionine-dependent methyltransferase [Longimycelium tulufanense]